MTPDWSTIGSDAKKIVGRTVSGPKCRMAIMLDLLADEDKKAVVKALENRTLTNSSLTKAFRSRMGREAPTLWSVSNHRRGDCRCSTLEGDE